MITVYVLKLDSLGYIESCGSQTYDGQQPLPAGTVAVAEELYDKIYVGLSRGTSYRYVGGDVIVVDTDIHTTRRRALSQLSGIIEKAIIDYVHPTLGTPIKLTGADFQFALLAIQLGEGFVSREGVGMMHEDMVMYCKDFLLHRNSMNAKLMRVRSSIEVARTKSDIERHITHLNLDLGNL